MEIYLYIKLFRDSTYVCNADETLWVKMSCSRETLGSLSYLMAYSVCKIVLVVVAAEIRAHMSQ